MPCIDKKVRSMKDKEKRDNMTAEERKNYLEKKKEYREKNKEEIQ